MSSAFLRIPNGQIGTLVSMGGNALKVYLALVQHRNRKSGRCFPGVDRLRVVTGLSHVTVQSKLEALRAEGVIARSRRGRGWQYRFPNASPASRPKLWSWLSPKGFVMISQREATALYGLWPASVVVYVALRTHRNLETAKCNPTCERLLDELPVGRTSLFKALGQLRDKGLLGPKRAGPRRSYVLPWVTLVSPAQDKASQPDSRVARARGGDTAQVSGTTSSARNAPPNQKKLTTKRDPQEESARSSSNLLEEPDETAPSQSGRVPERLASRAQSLQASSPVDDEKAVVGSGTPAAGDAYTAWLPDGTPPLEIVDRLFERYRVGRGRSRYYATRPGFVPEEVRRVAREFDERYAAAVSNPGGYICRMLEQMFDEFNSRRRAERQAEESQRLDDRDAAEAWLEQATDAALVAFAKTCPDIPSDDKDLTAANIRKYRVWRTAVIERLTRYGLPPEEPARTSAA